MVPIKATAFGFKLDNEVTKHPFIDDWYITTTDDGQARLELLSKILPQSGEARNKVWYKIVFCVSVSSETTLARKSCKNWPTILHTTIDTRDGAGVRDDLPLSVAVNYCVNWLVYVSQTYFYHLIYNIRTKCTIIKCKICTMLQILITDVTSGVWEQKVCSLLDCFMGGSEFHQNLFWYRFTSIWNDKDVFKSILLYQS